MLSLLDHTICGRYCNTGANKVKWMVGPGDMNAIMGDWKNFIEEKEL